MKKAFDQTVRELKRGVNKKVLKLPGIEQKILDATSNEPWGPHGSHLADIAQASRNYHEYQMIMNVIWKRINDTGKNWRHVFKALTVLEYLVAHGSERVIDEIREHAYQLSTLSDFQYIDSSGRDQGSNVRRKSQSLVALVNDKEKIQEVRQKALDNRDKYRNSLSRPGDRYDDDRHEGRYGYRDDERYGYGRERDWGNKNDDRYSRNGDTYGRDPDDHYGRDGYRDDDGYRGRGNDDYQNGSNDRRSIERDTNNSYEDDDRYPSRSSGVKADGYPEGERRIERMLSEAAGALPSYEEATRDPGNYVQDKRDGEPVAAAMQKASSPEAASSSVTTSVRADNATLSMPSAALTNEIDTFDEFDPRGSASAAPPAASSPDVDFFGNLSPSDSTNPLALTPVISVPTSESSMPTNAVYDTNFAPPSTASTVLSQPGENPFGDAPFKAVQDNFSVQPHGDITTTFQSSGSLGVAESFPPTGPKLETIPSFDFGGTLGGIAANVPNDQHPYPNLAPQPLDFPGSQATMSDILDALLPPTESSAFNSPFSAQPAGQTIQTSQMNLLPQTNLSAPSAAQAVSFSSQLSQPMASANLQPVAFPSHLSQPIAPANLQPALSSQPVAFPSQFSQPIVPANLQPAAFPSQFSHPTAPANLQPAFAPQPVAFPSQVFQPIASTSVESIPPTLIQNPSSMAAPNPPQGSSITSSSTIKTQPSKEKFETKSTVWADTLSRGLVDLNISGPKTNPLADIGVDFDSINRKEKRKEAKSSAAPATSTITMGKAMGAGSGIGRAGAGGMAPAPNPMVGSGMGMGVGMGMGGYGGSMNQQPLGLGMGMNMGMGMGMGMNMGGMGSGAHMRPPMGMPPGPGMPGAGYNPMMGMGNYGTQQPYGGGYR